MPGSITDVSGLTVGHYTDRARSTGCTVIVCEAGAVTGASIAGSVLGTHETDLVRSGELVERVQAVCLVGRSSYGLAAVSGVMRYLEERERGFPVGATGLRVPIVTAASIFDLTGPDDGAIGPAAGYAACAEAGVDGPAVGQVGVGTGCWIAKSRGDTGRAPGGIATASRRIGQLTLGVLAVASFYGEPRADSPPGAPPSGGDGVLAWQNTTIAVLATDAPLSKPRANELAGVGYPAVAATVAPFSLETDGIVTYALSTAAEQAEPAIQGARLDAAAFELITEAISEFKVER